MTIPQKTHNKQYSKTHGKTHNKLRTSRTSARLLSPILRMFGSLLLGSILLAVSCAPVTPGGGSGDPIGPSAPRVTPGFTVDKASVDSSSFRVQWTAPTTTGTKPDGTVLTSAELSYRVYYLAGTANEEKPSAESIKQNPATKTKEVTGVTSTTITGLEADTRYFVTIASYNTLVTQLAETMSDEVIEATTSVATANFEGSLAYAGTTHEFTVGLGGSIIPDSTPTILDTDTSDTTIRYSIARSTGTEFTPKEPTIDDSGVITIDPTTGEGAARYLVQAMAIGYTTQRVTLTITIIENANEGVIQVSTYYRSEATDVIPIGLGQAVADDGMFSLADADVVLTLLNLTNGEHNIHFGTAVDGGANIYSEMSYSIMVSNNTITIQKSVLLPVTSLGSFTDGAVIGISGPDITNILHVATYHPSNIYDHHDLQAIRSDLAQNYVLKRDIEFTPMTDSTGTVVSNYEAVGGRYNPFTGSLDGAGYSITGIQIVSLNDDRQGLFGVIASDTVDAIAVQNLVLRDFKITGKGDVGSLAGWVKQGTVDGVHVEASDSDTGHVTGGTYNVGGLVGYNQGTVTDSYATGSVLGDLYNAGGLVGDNEGTVTDSYATGSVSGVGLNAGGLVGDNKGTVTDSYATGDVTGTLLFVGGLAGYNSGTITESYATGSVTGSSYIGGLVGNNQNSGTVTGYATGSVTGTSRVGGLVGENYAGTVSGYATGSVTGYARVGGLVGNNSGNSSNVTGYATGSVTGDGSVGGLVGINGDNGTVAGYARGVVRRASGTNLTIGKTIGRNQGTLTTYSSRTESRLYDGASGTIMLTGTTGVDGAELVVDDMTMQATFSWLSFGANLSQWTWVDDGMWPAINIGSVKPANEQPVDRCSAESSEQCQIVPKPRVSTYHSTTIETLPLELGQAIVDDGMFSLADNMVILTVFGLADGDHNIHFGSTAGNYNGGGYLKTASNGSLAVLKSELAENSFSFTDGAVIGISGPGITGTQHVATYHPSNIYGSHDLQAMRKNRDGVYILKQDIVFTPMTDSTGTAVSNYEAVGDDDDLFTGSLDGAGYTITGIQIESTEDSQGLFGVMEASSVDTMAAQDLVLRDFKITGRDYVGSLAGWIKRGIVDGVHVEASAPDTGYATGDVTGKDSVGGLVGDNEGTVTDSYATGEVTGSGYFVGGLVGTNSGTVTGHATGTVTGTDYIGGLVGDNRDGTVTDSYATGKVTGTGRYIGGLVSWNTGTVTKSYATGDVKGTNGHVGGLVGRNNGTVTDSYATGDVKGTYDIGGLVGWNGGTVTDNYATGDVKGTHYVGGLVGVNRGIVTGHATGMVKGTDYIGGLVGDNYGTVSGYATGDVTGTDYVGGLLGYNKEAPSDRAENYRTTYTIGYATGSVIGDSCVGGLVGYNDGDAIIIGYATGSVSGKADVGGLAGTNDGFIRGYARGVVRRVSGTNLAIGKMIGNQLSSVAVYSYHSATESKIYNGATETIALTGTTGADGTAVTIDSSADSPTMRTAFSDIAFGINFGEWTWVADDKWPAINIGEVKLADDQPINP